MEERSYPGLGNASAEYVLVGLEGVSDVSSERVQTQGDSFHVLVGGVKGVAQVHQ